MNAVRKLLSIGLALLWLALLAVSHAVSAQELEAIKLSGNQDEIAIAPLSLAVDGQGDLIRVNTAADSDGVRRQMSVPAQERNSNPSWLIFALHNDTEKPITRWLTAEKYDILGSGIVWPDLDAPRVRFVTPSIGFVPQKVENERADIFQITVEPGQTVTYVAELASKRAGRVYLWKPLAYELKVRDRRLFNGIMLGITGLLGVFLTAVFAANHKAIFPSAALVAWCVLAYLCVDFGFWHKLLQLQAEDNAVYRAATEAAMAASFAIFVFTFLRVGAWHGFIRMLAWVWIVAALSLVFVAVLDPRLASTFARLSFGGIGAVGAVLTLFLALRGQDRALSLIPTWLLFLVWLFGASATLSGQLSGEFVVSSLVAGLTLIVVLLGFTVTQFAFGSVDNKYGTTANEQNLRALAVDGSGAGVWEWHGRRDEMKVSPIIESILGLNSGELSTKTDDFQRHMHPADQERFRLLLWSIQERGEGMIQTDFRLRHTDSSYRWFELDAASVATTDRRSLRCVGLMRDVTDAKRAQLRLMHDAVHDSLTNLPNRELFLDRLSMSIRRARSENDVVPKVIFIDIDKFKSVNSSYGIIVGDSLLLTLAKRLHRYLAPQDTLARVGGDQFAVLTTEDYQPEVLMQLADDLRQSIKGAIRIAGHDVVLTGAVGLAVWDGQASEDKEDNELLKEAEIAMYRAKRKGADQVEVFRPEMRNERDDRVAIESELRQAIERKQLKVLFQPIIYLPREELAGFEALVRWEHPRLGLLNPSEFIPVAEESDLIVKLGSYVLMRSVEQAAKWQKELPRSDNPLFVSVNVSSKQLFRQDLIQEIRHIAGRAIVPDGVLRLEITESLVMENPEQATEMLDLLKSAGARLALDDFGAGYSSLTYLQRFPFDTIKVDSDLIQASEDDGHGSAIVRSIVALAHELGKKVVAEGVEGPEDVGFLRSIGCEFAQGFYYGEPMGEREVTDLLRIVRKSERRLQRRGFFRTKRKEKSKDGAAPQAQWPPPGAPSPSAEKAKAALPSQRAKGSSATQPPAHEVEGMTNGARLPGSPDGQTGPEPPTRGAPQFKSSVMRTRRRGEQPQEPIEQPQTRSRQPTAAPPRQQPLPGQSVPGPMPPSHSHANRVNGNGAQPSASLREKLDQAERQPSGPQTTPQHPSNGTLPHQQSQANGRHGGNGQAGGPPPLPHQDQQGSGSTAPTNPDPGRASANEQAPPLPHAMPGAGTNGLRPEAPRTSPGVDGSRQTRKQPMPDLSNLPPGIAASLAKLAGVDDE